MNEIPSVILGIVVGWLLIQLGYVLGLKRGDRRGRFAAHRDMEPRIRNAAFEAVFEGGAANGKQLVLDALTRQVSFPVAGQADLRPIEYHHPFEPKPLRFFSISYRFDHAVFKQEASSKEVQ